MEILRVHRSRYSQPRCSDIAVGRCWALLTSIAIFVRAFRITSVRCYQLPARTLVLSMSRFQDIVGIKTVTARVFQGVPLSTLSTAARGAVLERLVRRIDTAHNPDMVVSDPVLVAAKCFGQSKSTARFDWLRGDARIECKSAQLCWWKHGVCWVFEFLAVKLNCNGVIGPPNFGQLLLALYTSLGIYVYRHDLHMGVSSSGRCTKISGHTIKLYGPGGERDWKRAMSAILSKLDASNCDFVEYVPIGDARLKAAASNFSPVAQDVYIGIPLADMSPKCRGDCLADMVRDIDRALNPHVVFADATGGLRSDGRRCGRSSAPYDWLLGNVRVECKSSQLSWNTARQHWVVRFGSVKLFPSNVDRRALFDELLLALSTPRGVYVLRHNLRYGLVKDNRVGHHCGCHVQCVGPRREKSWAVAVDCILDKFVAHSCEVLAFVHWN